MIAKKVETDGYYIRARVNNKWTNAEVPFQRDDMGRVFLTGMDVLRMPELEDFIKKYDKCFDYAVDEDKWYFDPGKVKDESV